jgi:hypothetical protein
VYYDSSLENELIDVFNMMKLSNENVHFIPINLSAEEVQLPKKNICLITSGVKKELFSKQNLNIFYIEKHQTLDLFLKGELEDDSFLMIDFKVPRADIIKLINLFFDNVYLLKKQKIQSIATKNLKNLIVKIQTKNVEKGLKKISKELQSLSQRVLELNNRWELQNEVEFFLFKKGLAKFFAYNIVDSSHSRDKIFPVEINENEIVYFEIDLLPMTKEKMNFVIVSLMNIFSSFEKRNLYLKNLSDKVFRWEEIFAHVPFPMALFSQKGDLVFHNLQFLNLKLLPSDCLKLTHNTEIETYQNSFKVLKRNYKIGQDEYALFVFVEGIKKMSEVDTEQLGIITSSVAHELNNPLSGILAALSLFELSFLNQNLKNEKSDHQEIIKEMKESALRCKQLVETFLGFSRFDLHKVAGSLGQSMEQALHLMRFRMIESNVKISIHAIQNISMDSADRKCRPFENSSIMTMVFYLLFGGLMTAYGHYMLLTFNQSRSQSFIDVHYWWDVDTIVIEIKPDFEFINIISGLKLLNYLLKLEGFELHFGKNRIVFHSIKKSINLKEQ